jgi:hypothetical protein
MGMGILRRQRSILVSFLVPWALFACGGGESAGTGGGTTPDPDPELEADSGTPPNADAGGGPSDPEPDPGVEVDLEPREESLAELKRLSEALEEFDDLSAAGFSESYPVEFTEPPLYDLANVAGIDLIQASSFKLNDAGREKLALRGFVIQEENQFPNFSYGYSTIYFEDLPVYVSADSILGALHRSYGDILKWLELQILSKELDALLSGMHQRLASGTGEELGSESRADADIYLSVARSLLAGEEQTTLAGGSQSTVHEIVELALAAEGVRDIELFGIRREAEDFSQFAPRGHYEDEEALERYFRAMIWLGRLDLRLIETQPDGSQLFRRRSAEAMFLLRALVDDDLQVHFDRVDQLLAVFGGEPDYLELSEVDSLAEDLGVEDLGSLANVSDQTMASAIVQGGYGEQRISSHIMIRERDAPVDTLPLSRSFALLGQRYAADSHVFSNVVYDRVSYRRERYRMMPNPLDVAFAALGNDQAGSLLGDELEYYEDERYPGALAKMRFLIDEHPEEFWETNLYSLWLGALRTLSPAQTSQGEATEGLFPTAKSEAWGRRLLNSQLASWTELRHDSILYTKQSYSTGVECEFPDAYVDPYPELYAAIARYGRRGEELVASLELDGLDEIQNHFSLLQNVAGKLQEMAEHERTGAAFTEEMLDFINDAVNIEPSCGGVGGEYKSGWYKQLFFDAGAALEYAPIVTDVHTQPTDEAGALVGRVLHVGTGDPRAMVVVAETCSGPRAYVGLASSYFEKVTEDFERLTDSGWAEPMGGANGTPDVPWMVNLLSPSP